MPSAPVILAGLKADLRPSFPTLKLAHLNEPNATSIGQGEQAAKDMGAVAYFECSARTGEGVVDLVESVLRYCLQRRRRSRRDSGAGAGSGPGGAAEGALQKAKDFFKACSKKVASRK